MKKKSVFSQIIMLIVISVLCIVLTITIALLVGSADTIIFDLQNLNLANMIPVIIIGGFISCVIVGITVLFVARNAFVKAKDYLKENNFYGGKEK